MGLLSPNAIRSIRVVNILLLMGINILVSFHVFIVAYIILDSNTKFDHVCATDMHSYELILYNVYMIKEH